MEVLEVKRGYDSTLTTITHFDPSLFGSGMHKIYYHYTDSAGCDAWDTMKVKVMPGPTIQFWKDSVFCIPAYGLAIGAHIDTTEWPDIKIYWSTGDTTARTRVYDGGWYSLTLYTPDSSCVVTDSFFVGDGTCCAQAPSLPGEDFHFSNENPIDWTNETYVIDQDIVIEHGYSGSITNCTLIMQNCSKIIVQGGAELHITNCNIGYCEWEGIEVWGNMDLCADDWGGQGHLFMDNTEINSANVAVMLGKRAYSAGIKFELDKCGGACEATACHFKGNYTDVLITPWTWFGICICSGGNGKQWQSKFNSCDFDTLANNPICNPFVETILDTLANYFNSSSPGPPQYCNMGYGFWEAANFPNPSRCHIVDLSPYIDFYILYSGGLFPCTNACSRFAWSPGDDITNQPGPTPNSYKGCTFDKSIIDCDTVLPHSNND